MICRILGLAVPLAGGFKMVRDWFVMELTGYARDHGLEIDRFGHDEDKEQVAREALVVA